MIQGQRRKIWGKNGEIIAAEGVRGCFLEKKKATFSHKELKIRKKNDDKDERSKKLKFHLKDKSLYSK